MSDENVPLVTPWDISKYIQCCERLDTDMSDMELSKIGCHFTDIQFKQYKRWVIISGKGYRLDDIRQSPFEVSLDIHVKRRRMVNWSCDCGEFACTHVLAFQFHAAQYKLYDHYQVEEGEEVEE